MTTIAMRIPEQNTMSWIDAVADMQEVRNIDVTGNMLDAGIGKDADRFGIDIACVREILPPQETRFLSETDRRTRENMVTTVRRRCDRCKKAGAKTVSLWLGLERVRSEAAMEVHIAFLRQLVSPVSNNGLTFALPVRYPVEAPKSKEWDLASNIVHDVMHPAFRLGVHLFPDEVSDRDDSSAIIRRVHFQLSKICIHYEPMFGEEPDESLLCKWGRALRWHGFRGVVVLCPREKNEESIAKVCRKADSYAATLRRALETTGEADTADDAATFGK